MCVAEGRSASTKVVERKPSLLLTTSSFNASDRDGDGVPPSMSSTFYTMGLLVAGLFASEHLFRLVLKDTHALFQNDHSHKVVARHLGVDFMACFAVAFLGIRNRHICEDLSKSFFQSKRTSKDSAMLTSGFEKRMFTYHPAAQQILLIFFAYQVKNLYDCVIWNDGPEFIFHHIAAGIVAWGAMYPGYGHFYVIFFMGISEVSTMLLVLLANFDAKHGVDGMGDAFPATKILLAVLFVVAFILCRTVMWPYASFHFVKDALAALRGNCPRTQERRRLLQCTIFCLTGLSILQVAWLAQIFIMAREEMEKMTS